jgi:hypothetical protein
MNLLPVARYYLSRNPSQSPIHSTDDARTKAPAARWGFRLVISSSNSLQHSRDARPADAERVGDGCGSEAWAFNSRPFASLHASPDA